MSETMKFRKAVLGDEGLILTFIRELADYEGMLDQVVADEATLHTWIFEKEKAEVLFVLEGAALLSSGSTPKPGSISMSGSGLVAGAFRMSSGMAVGSALMAAVKHC